ncbi:MAG: hypothetical protein GXO10_03220 [Crenarchaeota archaeon]|nr:hypothetical protein [Thermoproteota archaeon]
MKIIPVLDIKNLLVVQAIAGKREEYTPLIDSKLISSPIIERALQDIYVEGYREIYIADIDLIEERSSHDFVKLYSHMLSLFNKVYLDVGRRGIEYYYDLSNIVPVIGTEYVESQELALLHDKTMSLDMFNENVKFKDCLKHYEEVLYLMYRLSIVPERVLIIDLERVGTLSGIDYEKICNISRKLRDIGVREIFYGGGIRCIEDIKKLENHVDAVIVGSALHRGYIR